MVYHKRSWVCLSVYEEIGPHQSLIMFSLVVDLLIGRRSLPSFYVRLNRLILLKIVYLTLLSIQWNTVYHQRFF